MSKSNKLILGKCEYDPELRELITEGQSSQVIGHVQAKLLQLLYSNPDRYFSNDDLQREVWDGRIIENTTIRTTVSYLRKALGESEDCKYIDSGRNKGYRFVADIEEITPQRQLKKFYPFAVIAGLAFLLFYVVFKSSPPQLVPKIETTLVGQELEATVSGELMVFSHKEEGSNNWNLYSKLIGKERYSRLTDGPYNDRNASLSADSTRIAFNRYDGKNCQIVIADISAIEYELKNSKSVFTCPGNTFLASIAWKDNENLYLSYSSSFSNTYSLYQFNLQSADSKPITSPKGSGRGDYFVTVNRNTNQLAYLRNVIGNKTEIWVYDELSKQSRKIISIPLILMSVGWIDNNRLVVRTGNAELSSLDINSNKLDTLYEGENAISFPYAIDNHTIGYMRGYLTVRDIVQLEPSGKSKNIISSSFRDNSPVYAERAGTLAFISNRSGINQIWLLNKDQEVTQITRFTDNLRIENLTISRDGQYIAFVINAHLQIMGTDGTLKFKSKEKHLYKNPVFSADSEKVLYTSNVGGGWFIESRLMSNLQEKKKVSPGFVIKPCPESNCFYFIKYNESMLYKSMNGKISSTGVVLHNIARPDQLAIVGDFIYYLNREVNKPELVRLNMLTKEITNIMPLSASRFSIQEEPLRVFTSISRKPETFLQSITIID